MRTRAEAIDAAAEVLATADLACAAMTPREQAEAAWTPTSPYDVDQLEDLIRDQRGLPLIHQPLAG